MQKELLEDIRINRVRYEEMIRESIKEYVYQHKRYEVNFTLALGLTDSPIDMKDFAKLIRESDKFIILDDHLCCIVFPFTDTAQGVKAASNLLSEFEMQFFSEKIYVGIANADDCETPEKQIVKLFELVEYSVENGMENVPLDNTSF